MSSSGGQNNGQKSGNSSSNSKNYESLLNKTNDDHQDERLNELHSKVAALKAITIDIGNEVKDQNRFLETMEGEFDRAGSMITATIDRVRQLMVNQRGQNYLGYTVVFVVAVFILLYIIFL